MRIELEVIEHPAAFAAINIASDAGYQTQLVNRCSFPLFQDQEELDAVGHMGAKIYDLLLYDRDGNLVRYMPQGGEIPTAMGTPEGYEAVKGAILSAE
jgi:hypothetical protein